MPRIVEAISIISSLQTGSAFFNKQDIGSSYPTVRHYNHVEFGQIYTIIKVGHFTRVPRFGKKSARVSVRLGGDGQ